MIPWTPRALALRCKQSYPDEKDKTAPLSSWPGVTQVGAFGATCFVCEPSSANAPILLVFRGTNDPAGWLYNLRAKLVEHPKGGMVHEGFYDDWSEIKARVVASVKGRSVVMTGHSLGGALATLAAAEMADQVEQVTTFGAPRVGTGPFAATYDKLGLAQKTKRFVNQLDPVPDTPPALDLWKLVKGNLVGALDGCRHVCGATWYDGDYWRQGINPLDYLVACWHGLARKVSLGTLGMGVWAYHHIDQYAELVR